MYDDRPQVYLSYICISGQENQSMVLFFITKGVENMARMKEEELERIRQIDLLTYLMNYQPERLKKISVGTFCIRDHDSLQISNGLWHWHSMGIGGRSALDFLIKVDGYSFKDAISIITGKVSAKTPKFIANAEKIEVKKLERPKFSRDNSAAIDYLMSRGIAKEVIDYCISHFKILQTIYENPIKKQTHSNVAFIGYDKQTNLVKHIALRGIGSNFIGDASGSDKRFSFCIESKNDNCTAVHVCEAPIDCLSLATTFMLENKPFNQEHILSLTGIYAPENDTREIKIPVALTQFLSDYPTVKNIVFHLDLDRTGRRATELIIENMKNKMPEYHCRDEPPLHYKDMNDDLCIRLGIQPAKLRSKKNSKQYSR